MSRLHGLACYGAGTQHPPSAGMALSQTCPASQSSVLSQHLAPAAQQFAPQQRGAEAGQQASGQQKGLSMGQQPPRSRWQHDSPTPQEQTIGSGSQVTLQVSFPKSQTALPPLPPPNDVCVPPAPAQAVSQAPAFSRPVKQRNSAPRVQVQQVSTVGQMQAQLSASKTLPLGQARMQMSSRAQKFGTLAWQRGG